MINDSVFKLNGIKMNINSLYYSPVDNPKHHGKLVTVFEVEIREDEIKMIEKNFTRPYWSWELPSAYRKQITVSM